jgi:glycosyltransferase involved in cell wall biosynthesis/cold shock CspA family protein
MNEETTNTNAADAENAPDYGIIVHCHLRWDFVWQRPQHVMSRLSQRHPILFLEDAMPLGDDPDSAGQPRMQINRVSDTLTVARPLLIPFTGDPDRDAEADRTNGEAFLRLLDATVEEMRREHPETFGRRIVHWVYTPHATWLKDRYGPVAVAYDCMDELANFKGADSRLRDLEAELMRAADVVYTGGPSLYQARKDKHPNAHQFNSGVDVDHFRKALDPATPVPDDTKNLKHPVLLYYGVIDERMGWDNLAAVCDAHPDWSVLMVGPLAKIGEDDLLRRPNLHYTGQRGYDLLPGYLKACDVALVPFALSDATRFLSPTKTLEYFAARKPVVATPIQDIVDHYADAARIASTPDEFVRACEAAINEDNAARLDAGERHAAQWTWDNIVARMGDLLNQAVTKGAKQDAAAAEDPTAAGADATGMATGQVRWYSGSRGAGVVDTEGGDEVMAFLPGQVQEDLGGVREGAPVAVGTAAGQGAPGAGPAHTDRDPDGANMFPLGLDRLLDRDDAE